MTLKELREESGLKAKKIASKLGISRTQLYNLEKGIHKPDLLKIEKFAAIYDVPIVTITKAVEEAQRG